MTTPFVSSAFPCNSTSFYYVKLDAEGNYIAVNNLFQETFKGLCPDFVGKSFFSFLHPEDLGACQKAGEQWANEGSVGALTLRKLGSCGSTFYTHWNFFAEKVVDGKPVEVGCIGFDISTYVHEAAEKKLTEQKLETVLESTAETFYLVDTNMKIIAFSNGARNVARQNFGLELHAGFDFAKLLVPKTKQEFMQQFVKALEGKVTSTEDKLTFPTGHEVWFKLTMAPAKNATGQVYGVTLNFVNIDVLKKSEMQLKEIAWRQSHIVRKPVSNILGLVDLMKDEKDYAKMQDMLAMLSSSANELDDIIKDVVARTAL